MASLVINASDNINNLSDSVLGNVASSLLSGSGKNDKCPPDMVFVDTSEDGFCVDRYENSPGVKCANPDPKNKTETEKNLSDALCVPVSEKGKTPWRNIARHQAELACSKAGKRLPAAKEWYLSAIGTPDKNEGWDSNDCNVNKTGVSSPDPSGSHSRCVSSVGAYDMAGNVWEWVAAEIENGVYNGRMMPGEGYVSNVDLSGMPVETSASPDSAFFRDYFWLDKNGVVGIFRGGYWGNGDNAGIFSSYAYSSADFVGPAVGFRCVKSAGK